MGKMFFGAVATALFLMAIAQASADTVDGIAAIVNDRILTYSDVRELATPAIQNAYRLYSGEERDKKIQQAGVDALNTLVERSLVLHEYQEKGYKIPEYVFDNRMREIIEEQYGGDKNALIRTLQARGMTIDQWKQKYVKEPFIVQALRQKEVSSGLVISPAQIEIYFNQHLDKFKLAYQVRLRMIVIKKAGANTEEAAALAKDIGQKLDAGADFSNLANVYSSGNQRAAGGDWGWVDKESGLRKELADVAFSLKAGQHSGVIETDDGFYLIQADEVKPARMRPMTEVRGEIEKALIQEQRNQLQQRWIERLKKKAYIRYF
jgi:parvulin-like peptidyl-prolyl isomerase